jgi:hypothetical protein
MKINFLQIAISQWEHNNKLKGYFHCTIGINLDTYELTRIYPVERHRMRKNYIYSIEVEPMTCKRENSYKPININQVGFMSREEVNQILNDLKTSSIKYMNDNKLSMGIINIPNKTIRVETNRSYVEDSQFDLFENTQYSKLKSIENKSYSSKIKKDIRIKFLSEDTMQGYRDLSYNEHHFYIGLEKNGLIPNYYNSNKYNKMIVGNLRNHRNVFIGLCMFKS